MKNNNLPKYWAVFNDGSDEFKKVVIPFIKEAYGVSGYGGHKDLFYGYDGNSMCNGTDVKANIKNFYNAVTVLTIPEFARLSQPIDKKYVLKEEYKCCTNAVGIILEDEGFAEHEWFVEDTIISGTLFEMAFKRLGLLDLWFDEYIEKTLPKIGDLTGAVSGNTITYGDTTFTFRELKRFYNVCRKFNVTSFELSDKITISMDKMKLIHEFILSK